MFTLNGTNNIIKADSSTEKSEGCIISIAEYRKILNDHKSSDEQVIKRLKYLEALCRNIIRPEIKTHVSKTRK